MANWYHLKKLGRNALLLDCDTVALADFAKLLAIPLRDGCDVMDVIGRRMREHAAE